jgi:HD superfamily phosphodiesterase
MVISMKNDERENVTVKLSEKAYTQLFDGAAKEEPPPHIMSHSDYVAYVATKLV